ncbi:adenylate/guanylate cyclase domain-containing protein [Mesorhizobium abyssinicae]|uniref:ATP-binding protein n=1 Tax=Mesorhizobium TaxID=68287 RepID=UPI000FE754A6|nr:MULTISPECIES: adenylate/guanylate cyclase domain-containing protein [Mesorhizobium]MDX8434674.1 adenylate/guanylate cyclase domain-containing protein [Mesorhizobium abyssinicae]RWF34107.1 MAG: adenylate/guanylate cyclase domain-containing protein [Mesorhizobium sp.]RWF42930.1 MAG: adenylate/guanylate cyclase domain-containing protein [Mesorhizobium sp.]TIX18732.1 MAG: adenylate/guanylate cyclase domain-containing protein [Mesorhizobium sp.]TJW03385.1 MAG: adenylate/guanylate cyclase domain-
MTTPVPLASPILPGPAKSVAERRYLTILFCDMVGSTEYADRLDPEDFQRLIETFLQTCSSVVRRHKGVTASYIGDAIQAYFGYPIAGEDDSEVAVLAALEIVDAVATISANQGYPLQVRVGIASGQVVVGEFVGAPSGVSTVAFGHVAHLAARLQVLAKPNMVLVDAATFEAASGAIDFTRFGKHELKGFAEPVQVWQVQRQRMVPTRFAKRAHMTRLCGRNAELRLLMERWETVVRDRRGSAVWVSGESGIGKSRLLNEIQQRLRSFPQLTMQCSPTFENSTLYPFLAELQRIATIEDGDPTEEKLRKLSNGLSMGSVSSDVALAIFSSLLGIPTARPDRLEGISAERQRNIAEQALMDLVGYLARTTPILILFEDEQWADATSRELLDKIVASLAATPALLLVSSRNTASVPWFNRPDVHHIRLEALGREDAEAIVHDISPNAVAADVSVVLDRSEGVPLYIEELTRSVVETGLRLDAAQPKRLSLTNNIPNSLQFLLLARLDRLGPAKEVAQIAAAIGRKFDFDILREICDWPEAELRNAVGDLMRTGLVVAERGTAGAGFSFSHVLLQQAARGTMLHERAQQIHRLIAECIELRDRNAAFARPEVLAEHFADAGLFDRAADYWLLAGVKAAKTWAKDDAVRIFRKGLEAAKLLPDSDDRSRKLLRFELELGDVLYAAQGYVTGEGSAAYQRAIALSGKLGEPEATIRALDGLFGTHFNSGQFGKALAASDELIRVGEEGGYLNALVIGLQFKGMTLFSQGELVAARQYLERALSHKESADKVGSDFPSMAMIYLSWTLHILGYRRQALKLYLEAETTVRQQPAYRLAACLGNGCVLFAFREESSLIARLADELLPLAQENGFNLWARVARFFGGLAASDLDDNLAGSHMMALTENDLEDQEVDKSCYLGLLAKAFMNSGQFDIAAETVEKGLHEAEKIGEHYFTAALLRIRGEIELANGAGDRAAEASFREAIAFARRQNARSWELQATTSLAKLLRSQGRFEEARAELREINDWFIAADVA